MAVWSWLCWATSVVTLLSVAFAAVPIWGSPAHQQPPVVAGLQKWDSVSGRSVCRAQVEYSKELRVHRVWCADGVEGQVFEARGREYVCTTLRFNIPVGDSDIDVPGGCVARLRSVVTNPAKSPEAK